MKDKKEATQLQTQELLAMYRDMVRIREFEEACPSLYSQGKMGGFLHLYSGQEAVGVGVAHAIHKDDYMIAAYREHGLILAKGTPPGPVMAELFGKATGVSRGKGGSMHMFDPELRFMGGYGIVGGHLPLAVGMGYAIQYQQKDEVVVCLFGDGATNQGVFHEAMNLAALYQVPVVFVCENNMYGIGTAVGRASAVEQLYKKSCAYETPGVKVDGMDVLKVYEEVRQAVHRARAGEGPTYIEALTYRFRGHSISDPGTYRSEQEKKLWKERDPIPNFGRWLVAEGKASEDELKKIDAEEKQLIEEAIRFAEESPDPGPEELWTDVYVQS
ncbi:pyruvate dehydrogenase (acetyl-transferring) E1 component subunit alpha [Geoalkalibacter halelectricus]|uniref:Pyruvate dehydrogenase E1 component subunit alpha n=1 Tax=Geoalkalibacter halelectricus TaxID=2847045 RepID=A0ABY5ZPB7_9BACT|nr:pyruvate dehydrogenase (acetyl-transferring) E1 component subunit alpha [Geoalkalibacter halelectricus]MDO3379153.1 pyruvate dehydrogenase (acetyl-transferring) E1 component subunit alpha [Geoalkalibacter halelectricus]UWZ80913.1 pyruvate dehydrogenase (acetyl-transferring) E1 component subunit alpha [Geoalkalibacter halelectricus]